MVPRRLELHALEGVVEVHRAAVVVVAAAAAVAAVAVAVAEKPSMSSPPNESRSRTPPHHLAAHVPNETSVASPRALNFQAVVVRDGPLLWPVALKLSTPCKLHVPLFQLGAWRGRHGAPRARVALSLSS